jgi:predicted MFS family arabinose efflux permease
MSPRPFAREIFATRMVFFTVGVMIAAWAPLVPLAKARVGLDDGQLGLMLLGLGIGGLITMPLTGPMTAVWGFRRVILAMFCAGVLVLPALTVFDGFWAMTIALVLFGGAIGSTDVAMNLHAAEIERMAARPLMSNFHGMWSIGAFAGSAGMSVLLSFGLMPIFAATLISALSFVLTIFVAKGLLPKPATPSDEPLFVVPRGSIIVLGAICFCVYLSEHAVLDWSAVFLTSIKDMSAGNAGFGYAVFAFSMTLTRFVGDRLRARLGDVNVYVLGGLLAAIGYILIGAIGGIVGPFVGFALVGAGVANLVPIIFSAAGRARAMPSHLALTAVATVAHGGLLFGPAIVGFVSHATSLTSAFILLGGVMIFVTLNVRSLSRV